MPPSERLRVRITIAQRVSERILRDANMEDQHEMAVATTCFWVHACCQGRTKIRIERGVGRCLKPGGGAKLGAQLVLFMRV